MIYQVYSKKTGMLVAQSDALDKSSPFNRHEKQIFHTMQQRGHSTLDPGTGADFIYFCHNEDFESTRHH